MKVAVGYVRVSTLEQASEGVSLDAQRDKLRSYCKFNSIKLIDILADEGLSGSPLERPGLQTALQMLRRGRANTLIVIKLELDRLTRSVRDLCLLVDDYFGHERYFAGIARGLTAEGIRARRGGEWRGRVISVILQREGTYTVRPHKEYAARVPIVRDKPTAATRARELRTQGLSLRAIGARLRKEGLAPARANKWHAATIQDLLRYHAAPDRPDAVRRATELRAQDLSLSGIGLRLSREGHIPDRGGFWHPSRVAALLKSSSQPAEPSFPMA